ncbi:MAG: SDR family oxidoreductase [Nitrospina sp.]|nr:SDR family oxidoreductase [Nitrospina sp.]
MTASTKHLFCFGLGYTGRALGEALSKEGWRVSGTCRTAAEAETRSARKFDVFLFDGIHCGDGLKDALASADCVLSTVPPGDNGDPVLNGFRDVLSQKKNLEWAGYLSTTGVYGDQQGGRVDEDSPTEPESARGLRRVEAERGWRELFTRHRLPIHLFRLAAIYGPGRNALKRALEGTARRVEKPGLVFSRIHVDDVVQVLRASIRKPYPGRVYNLADDAPAPPEAVVRYACDLLELPPPPLQTLEEAGLSPLGVSFYQDSKRVANDRIKQELGVSLLFPDYRAGLRKLLETLERPLS